jgi:hypothetical protein
MSQEAPLSTKALRLVSLAIIVATVALAASAGYSGYQEYSALSKLASSQSGLNESFNGTTMTLSGLTIPNNMSYPLSLQLLGTVSLGKVHIADFNSQPEVIQPGQSKPLSLAIGLNFASAFANPSVLSSVLFNPFHVTLNTTISTSVIPLLGLNISKSFDQVYPPIFGNLSSSLNIGSATNSPDNKSILIPFVLNWNNLSPLALNGNLGVALTGVPGFPTGNYGNGSGPFSVSAGPNQNTVTLSIPKSGPLANEFMTGTYPKGTYTFSLNFATYGINVPLQESVIIN